MTQLDDPYLDPAVRGRIDAELTAIEREHGVRILLAVESGSRAWRFPSRDSDYDVRFLYLQPVEAYFAVMPRRDVIERPIDATLDVNGWDLRKALQLLVRSNAVLLEWLTSPVRYRDDGIVPAPLLDLARSTADPRALAYHYDHQARRSFEPIAAGGDEARIKSYCYALRAALALKWIRDRGEAPPMALPDLIGGLALGDPVTEAVSRLVGRKLGATEADTTPRLPILDELIGGVLAASIPRPDAAHRTDVVARADAFFASIVLGTPRPVISTPVVDR